MSRLLEHMRDFNLIVLILVCFVILLCWAFYLCVQQGNHEQFFQFRRVKIVSQAQYLHPDVLAKEIERDLHGGFFTLDTHALYSALKREPWIKEITFRRVWPDMLEVTVQEQNPVARWNQCALVNSEGSVFRPACETIPSGLIDLSGPEGSAQRVMQQLKKFQVRLTPIGAHITRLQLSSHNAWKMEINHSFIVELGQTNLARMIKRFAALYPQVILPREQNAIAVDLRYANGAAIQWKQH